MAENYTLQVNGSGRTVTVNPDGIVNRLEGGIIQSTGKRIRDLPFTPKRVKAALA